MGISVSKSATINMKNFTLLSECKHYTVSSPFDYLIVRRQLLVCQSRGRNDFIVANEKSASKKLVGNLTHLTNTNSVMPKHAHVQPFIPSLTSIFLKKEDRSAKTKEIDRGKKSSRKPQKGNMHLGH